MKERGVLSARRTQQFNGLGESDVIADELSTFHIECKGTKDSVLRRSTLKDWEAQLRKDCPEGKKAVLFWKANNQDWTVLVPMDIVYNTKSEGLVFPGMFFILDAEHALKIMLDHENDRNSGS